MLQLLVFTLENIRYALRLTAVERVVRAVDIIPLPKAPEIVLGVINFGGRVVPVLNIRARFRLPERELQVSDQLILARASGRELALVADAVGGVVERKDQQVIAAERILPALEFLEGVAKLEDGLILIHDLARFLSLEEGRELEGALRDA